MTPKSAREWIGVVGFLLTTVGAAYAGSELNKDPKLSSVDEAIWDHDQDPKAHPPIQDQLDQCRDLRGRLEGLTEDQRALGVRLVRLLAVDGAKDPRKRAQAASEGEEEFERLLRSGASLEDSMLGALRYHR